MTDSTPPTLAPELLPALKLAVYRLAPLAVPWAVTGSMGMWLQGVPVAVHDLDLQSDEQGVEAMADLLRDYIVEPPAFRESPMLRSYFGVLQIGAVRVELMGDLQKRAANGSWEPPTRVADYLRPVEWRGRVVPVLDLHYEEQAYRRLGRTDRANLLRRWLAGQGI